MEIGFAIDKRIKLRASDDRSIFFFEVKKRTE